MVNGTVKVVTSMYAFFLLIIYFCTLIFGQEMGLLEVKHGLLQVAETLDFLHNNARLVHRALSPEVYFIPLFPILAT